LGRGTRTSQSLDESQPFLDRFRVRTSFGDPSVPYPSLYPSGIPLRAAASSAVNSAPADRRRRAFLPGFNDS